jgi:hypothetical protein
MAKKEKSPQDARRMQSVNALQNNVKAQKNNFAARPQKLIIRRTKNK